jgi:hypothetical protein
MGSTASLRTQHLEMVGIVGVIQKKLAPTINADTAKSIRADFNKLAGILLIHLAMEDKVMYPKLLKNVDQKVSGLAKKFFAEMEGIKVVFDGYKNKWLVSGAIEAQTANFLKDTDGLFKALGSRISKEDKDLYPIVEQLGI